MISACILGLPAAALLLSSMPCFHLGDDSVNDKNKRSAIGGILVLVVGKQTRARVCKHTVMLRLNAVRLTIKFFSLVLFTTKFWQFESENTFTQTEYFLMIYQHI